METRATFRKKHPSRRILLPWNFLDYFTFKDPHLKDVIFKQYRPITTEFGLELHNVRLEDEEKLEIVLDEYFTNNAPKIELDFAYEL
jgi:hypothetical protein